MDAPVNTGAFFAFMQERENIRLRKKAGGSQPFTEDSILKEYKFTNVSRFHDWTTTKLREQFYLINSYRNPKDILMNCALFRYFGTFEFAEAVGWQTYDDFDFEEIINTATRRFSLGQKVFTGAYVITNQGISAPKQEVVVNHFLRDLHAATPHIVEVVQMTRSWEKVAQAMSRVKGFGGSGFMTKEVLLDTMMTNFWETVPQSFDGYQMVYPFDYDEWTPIGPGGHRGAARVCGHEYPTPTTLNKAQAMKLIHYLVGSQEKYWPKENCYLYPTDIQFQLCEFDKYERVRLGQGRPRSRYKPRS